MSVAVLDASSLSSILNIRAECAAAICLVLPVSNNDFSPLWEKFLIIEILPYIIDIWSNSLFWKHSAEQCKLWGYICQGGGLREVCIRLCVRQSPYLLAAFRWLSPKG